MVKYLSLANSDKKVSVDDKDYEFLSRFSWYLLRGKYVQTSIQIHRLLLNLSSNNQVDHINSNTLDNRRSNLREVTQTQNNRGRKSNRNSSSKYKGVFYRKTGQSGWVAKVKINGKTVFENVYGREDIAARVYDEVARNHFGKDGAYNFPRDGEKSALH